jgi:thiol-disulfide isomerase/thioredoxin
VRVVPCVIVVACLCLALLGCSSANRRQQAGGGGSGTATAQGAKPNSEPPDPIITSTPNPSTELGGILAGQVVDALNGKPVEARIRWVCLDDPKEEDVPVEAAATKGYFTIQGLKAGKKYKLVASSKQGERVMAGEIQTLAPNPRIVIKLKDDLVTQETPPVAAPGGKGKKVDEKKKKDESSHLERPGGVQNAGWEPGGAAPAPVHVKPPVGIRAPVPLGEGEAPPSPPPWERGPVDPSRIGSEQDPKKAPVIDITPKKPAPPLQVPPPGKTPVPQVEPLPPAPNHQPQRPPAASGNGTASCILLGKRLVSFSLPELNGQPWEYHHTQRRRGKLMLLDFWSTGCIPCLDVIPHLRILQDQYGPAGLQVVGIACEHSGTPAEQVRHVGAVVAQRHINYPVLLSGGPQCPVVTQINVGVLPTVALVDANGWIVWRHEGRMERHHLDELERRVQRWLGTNN